MELTEKQYGNLNRRFMEAKMELDKATEAFNAIKDEVKDAASGSELEMENVTVFYSSRTTVNYKKFIEENKLNIPDEYVTIKDVETVRYVSPQEEPVGMISINGDE
jgi:hypothetical protein